MQMGSKPGCYTFVGSHAFKGIYREESSSTFHVHKDSPNGAHVTKDSPNVAHGRED